MERYVSHFQSTSMSTYISSMIHGSLQLYNAELQHCQQELVSKDYYESRDTCTMDLLNNCSNITSHINNYDLLHPWLSYWLSMIFSFFRLKPLL